ncbi:MAG: TolC family protein, partial [Candidatus Scalindua sp.]
MFFELRTVIVFFILLYLVVFTGNDLEAQIKDYGKALSDILKVRPLANDIEEAEEKYGEPKKSDVEFSNDMKFLNMTLKDCIILAIHNNYDIKIAKLEPMIKGKDITVAKSVFDPILTITGEREVSETPTVSLLVVGLGTQGEITTFLRDTNSLITTIEKPIETGAKFTLGFNLGIREFVDPSPFSPLNPESTAYIEAKVTQPLLKNAGIFYNRSDIYIARNNKAKSILELKATAIEVINSIQTAYWELVKAIEELRVRKKSLEAAEDLLRKNTIQAKVGTLAPIEVLVAEESVAKKVNEIVEAENDIKNREDDLKLIMNLSNHTMFSDAAIIPLDEASFRITDVTLDESIKIALANRPELFAQGLDIANASITVKQKRNELLPKLDIEAGIRYNGLAGNFGNAIDSAFTKQFQSEFFGVAFEVPLGNREARNNYSKAILEARQSVLSRNKIEQEIVVE